MNRIDRFNGEDLDVLITDNNISPADRAMLADRYGKNAGVAMPLSKILARILDNKGVCYTLRNDAGEVVSIFGALPVSPELPSELQLVWEGILLVSWAESERNLKEAIESIASALTLVFDNGRTNITLCTQVREDFTTGFEKYGITVHRDKKIAVNGVNYVYCSVNGQSVERLRQYLYPVAEPQTDTDEVTDVRDDISESGNEPSDGSGGTPADQETSEQSDQRDESTDGMAATVNQNGSVESGSWESAGEIPITDARG